MRLRITSDGTGEGTQVQDVATGELLEGLAHVHWSVDAHGRARCVIAVHEVGGDLFVDDGRA